MLTDNDARPSGRYDAILFDLLSALIDSWSLWDEVAGSLAAGRAWRMRYLELTYAAGRYRPYGTLVRESARTAGVGTAVGDALLDRWHELRPWPEASGVLGALAARVPLGVLTNCSVELGAAAAASLAVPFRVVVTAEEAGVYKPLPAAYHAALAAMGTAPARTLFVAGSPGDVGGAGRVGMPVVWHNRIGLEVPDDVERPLAIVDDLTALPALVGAG